MTTTTTHQSASETGSGSLLDQALEFFRLPEVAQVASAARVQHVIDQVTRTGTYSHTPAELELGAKIAWRNHARCAGRASWQALEIRDARHLRTAEDIARECWEHLRQSTNAGRLRAMITVFRPASARGSVHIVNPQLIRYAGHAQPDGSVVGDPSHVQLTDMAKRLGWRGRGTRFDVLPLMLSVDGAPVQAFDVPDDAVLEVPIVHPDLPWFAALGLKWHANPAISNMALEIGGIVYPAAPFSGWYVSTEIGARNFADTDRYDQLAVVAAGLGLDVARNDSMWRDRALVELTAAVLHSYRVAGVHMLDHHTAASQFVRHIDREHALGRAVPADWAWVNPPMSASTTATFRCTFDPPSFDLRPNFVARAAGLSGAGECPIR